MSDQTSHILNEIFEDEKFIETHTPYSESFEKKNLRRNEKSRQHNVDENKNSMI